MELSKLINSIKAIQVSGEVERKEIGNITSDSRSVKGGSLFVAITGFNVDGHKFILDAINKGATAVILENNDAVPDEIFIHRKVTKILVQNSRKALAEVSNSFYKEPTKKLDLVGITGTKGKTTTSYFLKSIFENFGNKVGLIGTIANYIGDEIITTTLTTPESSELNSLFANMVDKGCKTAVMEVSSHSLVLNRIEKLRFKSVIFTNITSDHLDFHNTFDEYFNAKKILFDKIEEDANVIFNLDDPNGEKIVAESKGKKFSFGTSQNADFIISNIEYDLDGTTFQVRYINAEYKIKTKLIGFFNAYNAVAAFASAVLMNVPAEIAIEGIENTPQVPGRFETLHHQNKKVIVDYSHTADSLEKALQAVQKIVNKKRKIYTVFGCGGNRDTTKRPIMGKIASELSDKVIVTSDNPRYEDPLEIIDQIIQGIEKNNYEIIENREDAIKKSVQTSEADAVILIAGKGHETYQEIEGVRKHFSDLEIAEKYLNEKN